MVPHAMFAVDDASQVGEVRRHATRLAQELAFDDASKGRVALVVAELGNNLVKHAQAGRLLIGRSGEPEVQRIEVISVDRGPGMADVGACMVDGYSSSGTPGTGLGAVRRLANEFHYFSQPGDGTVILARMASTTPGWRAGADPACGYLHGAIALAAPGECVSGDAWAVRQAGGRAAVLVADGLGHGPLAAAAADAAIRVFEQVDLGLSPSNMLGRAHVALGGTRGAAVTIATLDDAARSLELCGVGNVTARLISGVSDRTLVSQHGTVGLQIRTPRDVDYPWPDHAVLIMHSDGVRTRWDLKQVPGLLQCHPSVIAAWIIREHCRDKDDATVVVLRRDH